VNIADTIAVAIVEASRITGADPLAVARGDLPDGQNFAIPRARAYAAAALSRTTSFRGPVIARCVGSRHPLVYVAQVLREMPKTKWWDPSAVEAVLIAMALRREASAEPVLPPPLQAPHNSGEREPSVTTVCGGGESLSCAAAPGRPFVSDRQAKAYADLAAAVRNTAALPKD
jgi:hypothetical protein